MVSAIATLILLAVLGVGVQRYLDAAGSDAELYAYNASDQALSLSLSHEGSEPRVVKLGAREGTTFKLTTSGTYTLTTPGQTQRTVLAPPRGGRPLRELHVYGDAEFGFVLEPHFIFPSGTSADSQEELRESLSGSYASSSVTTTDGKADLSQHQIDSAFAGKPATGRAVEGQNYVVAWELRVDK
ncbi:MAG TPA: hypothetical protein DEA08_33025 [Planctomycetes bacterium]|nr:hypothetical protein [Planctomycetota bacterium]